ncbi:MAG TPA: hypothetical protein DIT67_09425 [Octadecabacter sp.]|nr:hypothetical protein [Octadecabacter sp.]
MSDKELLIVQLEARVNDFEKRMKKAERTGTRSYTRLRRGSRSATRAMERDMLRSSTAINKALATTSMRIGGFGKAMATGLAAGVVTAALAGVTGGLTGMVKGIAAVGDEAKRSGLSASVFQEWKFVAEQNRIGVDQLIDGFKELNLRADEFAVTGKGPAAEAFQRIGFTGQELKRKLKDPSKLMLEIIGRMEDLDKAAQIRVADEVFGGSAGERFVELLSQGEQGLRNTISRAHELGAVMDDEMIAKADELDRKFGELAESASRIGKGFAVGVADFVDHMTDMSVKLDDYMDTAERARNIVGPDAAGALEGDADAIEENAGALRGLDAAYDDMAISAQLAVPYLERAALMLRAYGEDDAAQALTDAAAGMRDLVAQMEDGLISAEDFETRLEDLATKADEAFGSLDAIDQVEFQGAISAIGGLVSALSTAIKRASTLRETLPVDPGPSVSYGPPRRGGHRKGSAPTRSIRPRAAPPMLGEPELPTGGGGSNGDDYQRQVTAIREKTAALEAEALALVAAAASGKGYGDALEYARKRAELMNAAQKAGKDITPQLQAEIDALAASYVTAGDAAGDAADKLEEMEDAAGRGADAISDIFLDVMEGSRSAKEAVADLLREIARIQFRKAIAGLGSSGGPLGFLGGLLGYASGGYTGAGGVNDVAGVVHKGEYVMDAASTRRIGVGNLEAMQSGKMQGGGTQTVELILHAPEYISIEQVRGEAVRVVQAGLGGYDRTMSARVGGIAQDRHQRY